MERLHHHTLLHRTSYKTVLSQYILVLDFFCTNVCLDPALNLILCTKTE